MRRGGVPFDIDVWLFDLVTSWRARWLDALMMGASAIGRHGLVWLVLAGWAAAAHPRHHAAAAWRLALALVLTFLVVDALLKPLAARPRPFDVVAAAPAVDPPGTPSFPSGHAASAFAGAWSLSRIWPAGRVAWFLLAALIAISRVYLGVHFPLDVLAGALVGCACAWVVTMPR